MGRPMPVALPAECGGLSRRRQWWRGGPIARARLLAQVHGLSTSDDRRRATSDRATLGGMTTATEPSGSAGSARSTGAGLHQHGRRAAPLASVLLFLVTGCQGTLGIPVGPMGDRLRCKSYCASQVVSQVTLSLLSPRPPAPVSLATSRDSPYPEPCFGAGEGKVF